LIEVDNQFELLYDEKKKFSQRRDYDASIYPLPELVPQPNTAAAAAGTPAIPVPSSYLITNRSSRQ